MTRRATKDPVALARQLLAALGPGATPANDEDITPEEEAELRAEGRRIAERLRAARDR